ncbi:hypothetical protein [Solilutibacter silvestris]|uniref:DUF8082 domain-containing protein n=1 Tax=Solilutibacter silvestris TaxID=1645665 RepID=A0A2K1PYM9_9GAMM|nr:hypothetical protein [Lysobacter silvestris]PNS07889.1 hypothetical protein Lysil_2065 [Lysobacter silvestris]
MSNDFRPLIDILRELRSLAQKKASGILFIVTADNHSCMIKLHAGQIEEVVFRMLRNDEAVQRLGMVEAAKSRFQAEETGHDHGRPSHLSEDALLWLLGGFERDLAGKTQIITPASVKQDASDPRVRSAVEDVALNHLGPIAGMLCDEVFEGTNQMQQIIEQLAANLSTAHERQQFTAEVHAALAKIG